MTGHLTQHKQSKHLSSSNNNVGMMTELECPVESCEYKTETNRGLSIHASSKHEDLDHDFSSRKTDTCDFCGDDYKYYPSRRDREGRENFFCSRECSDKFKAKDGLDTECSECGESIHIPPSQVKEVDGYEQKNHFCDKECESSFKSREWVKEDHPSWDGGREQVYCQECSERYYVKASEVEKTSFCSKYCMRKSWETDTREYDCANCGDTVTKKPYNVKGENTTCSDKCHKEFMRSTRKGEDNPCWNGGRFEYYGPNWNEQRERALERDKYECQECGMTMREHLNEYDRQLEVHHKVKRREIINEDNPTMDQFELANSLDNLVTLCISCHKKLED